MSKKTLVIGASLKPERYSNMAIRKLVNYKHEVVALGLRKGEVAGIEIDTNILQYKDIDTVSLYLNPKRQKEFYYYIISLAPKRVIFNPGTENVEFYKLLKKFDIEYEEACTLVLLSTGQF
jgi:predicted CoA-binding protein